MMRFWRLRAAFSIGLVLAGFAAASMAMADGHGERGDGHEAEERHGRAAHTAPESAVYKQECSSCHFLYPAGLLPERAWEAIVNGSDKHFGENLALDDKAKKEVLDHLKAYSAERSKTEWSRKILRSIPASVTPARITETPFILKEHRKLIREDIFKRPSIKTFSNCGACHPRGAEWDFEEDAVRIPK